MESTTQDVLHPRLVDIIQELGCHMGTLDDPSWVPDVIEAIYSWQAMRDQREDEQRFGKPRS